MGFLSGWSKYKPLTLAATAGDETNLIYHLTVSYESAMQADFDDIRFTDSNGTTLLSQFREEYTASTSAVWWFLVPNKPAAGKTIYMYYGNAGASLSSSMADVFANTFYDDFSGDLSKWTESGNYTWSIVGSQMKATKYNAGDGSVVNAVGSWAEGYGLRFKARVVADPDNDWAVDCQLGVYDGVDWWAWYLKSGVNKQYKSDN